MANRLQQEIKQRIPFASIEVEALLNITRTEDELRRRLRKLLGRWSLTPSQYNVLRILRGSGEVGLTCGEIGDRLVAHAPDITRLLERMVRRGLVTRGRDAGDKRLVQSRITRHGLALLEQATVHVESIPAQVFQGSTSEEILTFIGMLERLRCPACRMNAGSKVDSKVGSTPIGSKPEAAHDCGVRSSPAKPTAHPGR